MEGTKQLVPLRAAGLNTRCAWAPEPVFTLEESARLLGISSGHIRRTRARYPGIKIEPKGDVSQTPPFRNEFGEVRLTIETPGGPQEAVCLTHYGLFRHAIFIRTKQARTYALNYPAFLEILASGQIKPVARVADVYTAIFNAPHGEKRFAASQAAAQLGKSLRQIWRHCRKIREGKINPDGTPIQRRPGPEKGFRNGRQAMEASSAKYQSC
jgi:hypothetical protein